jgi:hypothetical protein
MTTFPTEVVDAILRRMNDGHTADSLDADGGTWDILPTRQGY